MGDRIYLELGGKNGKAIAALSTKDGRILWQALDDAMGQGSAIWAEVNGRAQVIFFTGTAAVGVAPADGKLLWRYPWKTQYDLNIATPIYTAGHVFISSNYRSGGALFRLNGTETPDTVWKNLAMQNHIATSVLHEGHLYGTSENRLRCVDFKTGEERWNQPGYGKGSVALADGHLIGLGDHGELALIRATPKAYTEVSRCQIFDKDTLTWTVPIIANGRLYIRCENELAALDLRP
jgi:outer membrane protein assembly factor BamB